MAFGAPWQVRQPLRDGVRDLAVGPAFLGQRHEQLTRQRVHLRGRSQRGDRTRVGTTLHRRLGADHRDPAA